MDWRIHTALGIALSGGASALAWRLHALAPSGAWAAAVVGVALSVGGGWTWLALVGAFFATSSILTIWTPRTLEPRRRSVDITGRRWDQVVANGGVAALAAIAYSLTAAPVLFVAAAGAAAAATADTWATEVGRWSPAEPRMITTWRCVAHGTSGAVTPVGTAAAAAGSFFIAVVAAALSPNLRFAGALLGIAAAGFSAALLDSLLGATVESRWPGVTNSLVNLIAALWGACVAVVLLLRLSPH